MDHSKPERLGQVLKPVAEEIGGNTTGSEPTLKTKRLRWPLDEHALRTMRIPKLFWTASLDDFEPKTREKVHPMLDGTGFFLWGAVGTGKSHLAAAILREWYSSGRACWPTGYSTGRENENGDTAQVPYRMTPRDSDAWCARFVTVPDLLAEIRHRIGVKEPPSAEWIIRSFQNAQCLVLDDLGTQKTTEWTFEALGRVIDFRVREMIPMVVTSNLSIGDLSEWHQPIASRLSSLAALHVGGADRRPKRKGD